MGQIPADRQGGSSTSLDAAIRTARVTSPLRPARGSTAENSLSIFLAGYDRTLRCQMGFEFLRLHSKRSVESSLFASGDVLQDHFSGAWRAFIGILREELLGQHSNACRA
ncbi:hypothetical protein B2J88_29150 [Rhodococcus sp. SRB_17]|nr:hypothetical protein [Rhodococcus sp. SRB_17]